MELTVHPSTGAVTIRPGMRYVDGGRVTRRFRASVDALLERRQELYRNLATVIVYLSPAHVAEIGAGRALRRLGRAGQPGLPRGGDGAAAMTSAGTPLPEASPRRPRPSSIVFAIARGQKSASRAIAGIWLRQRMAALE